MNIKCFISLKVSTFTSDHLHISIRGHEILFKSDNLLIILLYFCYCFLFLHSWLFLQQEETSAKQVAERKTTPYPFLIFQGDLDFSASKVHLAAGKIILCTSETSIVEGTLAMLATIYVFVSEYPPGLCVTLTIVAVQINSFHVPTLLKRIAFFCSYCFYCNLCVHVII